MADELDVGGAAESVASGGASEGAPDEGTQTQAAPEGGGAGEQAPQGGDAPWANDLRGLGLDDETFSKVDGYMRESIQPRMTQLEQAQLGEGQRLFWDEYTKDPDQAVLQLLYETYGEEALPFFQTALQYAYGDEGVNGEGGQATADDHQQGALPDEFDVELDPEDRSLLDEVRADREDQAYRAAVSGVVEANKDHFPQDIDAEGAMKLLAPFVMISENGTIEEAFDLYKEHAGMISTPAEAEQVAGEVDASGLTLQALGQEGLAPNNAEQKQYKDLGEAIEDMLVSIRGSKGPPALG